MRMSQELFKEIADGYSALRFRYEYGPYKKGDIIQVNPDVKIGVYPLSTCTISWDSEGLVSISSIGSNEHNEWRPYGDVPDSLFEVIPCVDVMNCTSKTSKTLIAEAKKMNCDIARLEDSIPTLEKKISDMTSKLASMKSDLSSLRGHVVSIHKVIDKRMGRIT